MGVNLIYDEDRMFLYAEGRAGLPGGTLAWIRYGDTPAVALSAAQRRRAKRALLTIPPSISRIMKAIFNPTRIMDIAYRETPFTEILAGRRT